MVFPIAIQIFHGVEFRAIRRKKFQLQLPLLLRDELLHQMAAGCLEPIPNYQDFPGEVTPRMREKFHYLGTGDGARKQTKVEIPPSHARHARQRLPIEVILEHGCLPPRGPGATAMRPFAQPALVDEDDHLPVLVGFLLSSGQRRCFHWRLVGSSRSSACPVGHWQLHPMCRSTRHTCPG